MTAINKINETLEFIAQKNSVINSTEYLKNIARFLAEMCNVNLVLIHDYSTKTPNTTETKAKYHNGAFIPNNSFDLINSPCKNVIDKSIFICPKNIQAIYPKDESLVKMKVESYAGILLRNTSGEPIGFISIMDRSPIKDSETIQTILKIVALKVAQILDNIIHENELKTNEIYEDEELYKVFFNSSKISLFLIIDRKFICANKECQLLLDSTKEELHMKLFDDFLHPDSKQLVHNNYKNRLAGKTVDSRYEIKIILKSGKIKILDTQVKVINYKGKKALLNSCLDITENKKAVKDLIKSNRIIETQREILNEAQRIAHLGHIEWTIDSSEIKWSKEVYRILGVDFKIVPDLNFFLGLVHSDDLKYVLENLDFAIQNKKKYHIEHRIIRHDNGEVVWVKSQAKLSFYKGKPIKLLGTILDISNQKKIEKEVVKSKRIVEYQSAIMNEAQRLAEFGSWTWDIEHNTVTGSKEGLRILGIDEKYSKDLLECYKDLIHPDDLEFVTQKILELFESGGNIEFDFQIIRPNGIVRQLKTWNSLEYDVNRKPLKMIGATMDITEISKQKRALYESEKMLSDINENSPDLIFNVDRKFNIKYINRVLNGYIRENVIGRNILDFISEGYQEIYKQNLKKAFSGKKQEFEFIDNIVKEQQTWYSVRISPMKEKNEIKSVLIISTDITKRKQAQEEVNKLLSVVEQTADHVLITDKKGFIEYVNPAFEELTGYKKKEIVGKEVSILKSGLHDAKLYKELWSTILSGDVFRCVLINKKKNGNLFYGEETITPIRNEKMKITHFVSTAKDVTEKMETEKALRTSNRRLSMLYESSGDAIVIHNGSKFLDCNLAALKLSRCNSKAEFLKTDPAMLNPDIKYKSQLSYERLEVVKTKGITKFETIFKRMDGTTYDAEVLLTKMKFEEMDVFQAIIRDISVQKQEDNKQNQFKEKLRALASRIEHVREEERTYISREIHDELGHTLTILLIDLHDLCNNSDFQSEELTKEINAMIKLVNHSIETVQNIASNLRPGILDKLGLGAAVKWQLEEFKKRNNIKCISNIEDIQIEELSKEKITAIFRIFQELLTNISRHAKAKKVSVILKTENRKIKLFITDDGIGIKKENINSSDSLGILGMQERINIIKGDFSISGSKMGGTKVDVIVPINN